jgi:ferric iron reductase protein FhuF
MAVYLGRVENGDHSLATSLIDKKVGKIWQNLAKFGKIWQNLAKIWQNLVK